MLGAAWFAAGALLGALLTQGTPAAWADFRGTSRSGAQFSADVLQPPSGLNGSSSCRSEIDLSWTASPTSWTERYEVALATVPEGPFAVRPPEGDQSPTATSRWVGGLDRNTTYWVTVRAVRGSWSSGVPPVSVTTRARRC